MKPALLIAMFSFMLACTKKEDERNCTEPKSSYTWQAGQTIIDSSIVTNGQELIVVTTGPGDDLLFTFRYDSEDCSDIADEEYVRFLRFLVPAGATEFDFSGDDLLLAKTYVTTTGYTAGGADAISIGRITGNRTSNNQWEVSVDIIVDETPAYTDRIRFDQTFTEE